jgi:hypothetical protein
MTQRSIQRTAAAVLIVVLALATPAYAAGRHVRTASPGWLDNALQWMAQLWIGAPAAVQQPGMRTKYGAGIDPDGATVPPQPPSVNSDKGAGIAPKG